MVQDTRELNRSAVLTTLLLERPASRKKLATAAEISAATVTRTVEQLIGEDLITETQEIVSEQRGRRAVQLDLRADLGIVAGVDLGASKTRIVIGHIHGTPLAVRELATPGTLDLPALIDWLAGVILDLSSGFAAPLRHVALGVPGSLEIPEQRISHAPNLPQIEGTEFLAALRRSLPCPVVCDNDANFALLGELHFGAAAHSPNAALLSLGFGLGSALAMDGRVLRGTRGLVGEFGQLPIGPMGARLEHLVTGGGILRQAELAGIALESPADLFVSDPAPRIAALRQQFEQGLMVALTAVSVSCDPDTVVLSGGLSRALAPELARYQELLGGHLRLAPRLELATLDDFSGAVGAMVSALQHCYRDLGALPEALPRLPRGVHVDRARLTALKSVEPVVPVG
ncbi:ROK family protein [Mycetocola saprophilus]|uniref:ROK family protein n=1 Tax=Mycetocola saprophilus TaxID=76636 RepID=UPI003BF077A4